MLVCRSSSTSPLDAVNSSKLKLVGRSPAHCKAGEVADPKETEALRLGRLIHCAVLEPERLAEAYCVKPDPSQYPGALTSHESYKVQANLLGLKISGSKAVLERAHQGGRAADHFLGRFFR